MLRKHLILLITLPMLTAGMAHKTHSCQDANLFAAISQGDAARVQAYITQFPQAINARDARSHTPLWHAVCNGDFALVRILVDHGAIVNDRSGRHTPPLKTAARNGREDIVRYLCIHGAYVNAVDSQLATALHTAAANGHLSIVQCLVQHGAHVNAQDSRGYTPLHSAAQSGATAIVQYLVEKGARYVRAQDGTCPLKSAVSAPAEYVKQETIFFLIMNGHEVTSEVRDAINLKVPGLLDFIAEQLRQRERQKAFSEQRPEDSRSAKRPRGL